MRISAVAFLMILTTMFLSGCGQEHMAAVEDKGTQRYARNSFRIVPVATTQAASVTSVESRDLMAPGNAASNLPRAMVTTGRSPFGQPSRPLSDAQSVTAPPTATVAQNTAPYMPVTGARWQWPVNGKVIQSFGPQRDGISSDGITISAAEGVPIRAAQAGEVAYVGQAIRDYGNMLILRHADGMLSSYAHAKSFTVSKGQQVAAGNVIGYVGKTGSAKTPQLHFAVREGTRPIDPMGKLSHDIAYN